MPGCFRDARQTENGIRFMPLLQQTNGPIARRSMIATWPLSVFEKQKRRIHLGLRYFPAAEAALSRAAANLLAIIPAR
jgi:hypothetical protein